MRSEEASNIDPRPAPPLQSTEVDEVVGSLEQGLRGAVSGFSDALERGVSTPLRDALAKVSSAHRIAMAEAGLLPDTGTEEAQSGPIVQEDSNTWGRYSAYRRAVLSEVFEPLQDALLSSSTGQDLEAVWASFKADLLRLVAALPIEVRRPEPPDLFLQNEGDPFLIHFGKGLVRAQRLVSSVVWKARGSLRRLAGRAAAAPPITIQVVPVQRLAEESILGSLQYQLEGLKGQLHRHYAAPLAALEGAVARWARGWPPLEMKLEKGGGYLPQELKAAISDALERIGEKARESNLGEQDPLQREGAVGTGKTDSEELPISAIGLAEDLARPLDLGAEFTAPSEPLQSIEAFTERAWEDFLGSVRVAGSFMQSSSAGPPNRRRAARAEEQASAAKAWIRWHRTLPNRILLSIHVLRLREEVTKARGGLVKGVAEAALFPLADLKDSARLAFRALVERADHAFSPEETSLNPAAIAAEVRALLEEGSEVLEGSWLPALDGIEDTIHRLGDEVSTGLAGCLLELPDTLSVQTLQSDEGPLNPARDLREVSVRESARQTLDVLRLERVRNAPEPLLETLPTTRNAVAELLEALRFNLEAAREELLRTDPDHADARVDEAASLAREGLARAEDAVTRLLLGLPEGWHAVLEVTEDILGASYGELHSRLTAEGGVQEQLIGVRDRFRQWIRVQDRRARTAVARMVKESRRAIRKWTVRGYRAIRFGREVVGAGSVAAGEGDRALSVIRQAPEVLSGLPLIYRRLFSFEPLTDPALLKGRVEEEAWVRARFESWERGMGGPALMTGPVGAGHTSFFNVLSGSVFSGLRLHRLELTKRILEEDTLSALLAKALGLPGDVPSRLADLGALIRAELPRGTARVVLIERLEHVFLRTPGGTNLFEDFLSLQAQTSDHVFWLSSMSGAAWKLVAKTEPRAASLIQVQPLTPPSREELEELILARHGRSGLPMEFRAPRDLNVLVRRRLRLSRGEKAHQKILQQEYFDRLHRMSQDSIPLAILYWLRSTDFRSGEGKLLLTPPTEIRYAFLDELDLELDFALKAFLEHGSLTLAEYKEVFAATEEETVQTFEALRARFLLEPAGTGESIFRTAEGGVGEGVGYRIPALLSQVVARRLKSRNILH